MEVLVHFLSILPSPLVLCCVMLRCVVLCRPVLCFIVLHCVVLCCVLPSCAVLYCVMLLCLVLSCLVLSCLVLAAAECIAIDLEMTGIPDFEINTKADSPSMRYLECHLMSHFSCGSLSVVFCLTFQFPSWYFSIFFLPLTFQFASDKSLSSALSGIKNASNKFPNTV